jgi:hypothetical protein
MKSIAYSISLLGAVFVFLINVFCEVSPKREIDVLIFGNWSGFEGFQTARSEKKINLPDSQSVFYFQRVAKIYRKMIKDLYFMYVVYSQIWLNLLVEDDWLINGHFFHIFLLLMIATLAANKNSNQNSARKKKT